MEMRQMNSLLFYSLEDFLYQQIYTVSIKNNLKREEIKVICGKQEKNRRIRES